jgi:RsiW-degrading membrane proteinase PrsW (M82 family)
VVDSTLQHGRIGFGRDIVRYALLTILAEVVWLAFGLLLIGGLDKTALLPPWWVASTAIPAAFVVFLLLRSARGDAPLTKSVVLAITLGAAVAFPIAAPLNGLLIRGADYIWFVGLDEEFAKLVAALLLSIGLVKSGRGGLFVGVAVGLSFALWETACYYFVDYLGGTTDVSAMIAPMLNRSWLGVGLHPLFTGPIVAAVFSAIGRPSSSRVIRAIAVFALMAGLHSGYDWLAGRLTTDAGAFLLPPGDWIAVGLQATLLVVIVIVLRRMRRASRATLDPSHSEEGPRERQHPN